MKYAIKVNEVKKENGNVKGFATVVFGDSFKITNIAIVENKDKGQLFVSMPRYMLPAVTRECFLASFVSREKTN